MSLPTEEPVYYELYRDIGVGLSLLETLDDFVTNKGFPPHVAAKMMKTFDKVMAEVLTSDVNDKVTFKGKQLLRYSGVEEIWWFTVKDVTIHFKSPAPGHPANLFVEKLRIVAFNGSSKATSRTDNTN